MTKPLEEATKKAGEMLSRYGLYDGVWKCYICKAEAGTHTRDSICPNAAWEDELKRLMGMQDNPLFLPGKS